MYSDLFTAESLAELKTAFLTQFPMALWETFYVTVLSTALAILLGLPLGVLLVAGEADDVVPYAENGAVMAAKMAAAGGRIHVILKPGVGHHPHSLEDPAPITAFMEAL